LAHLDLPSFPTRRSSDLNNVVYLQWVQDAAAAHWGALAPAGARDQIAWVALRHEIDYLKPAVLGDEITVATWVGVAEGLSFERLDRKSTRLNSSHVEISY